MKRVFKVVGLVWVFGLLAGASAGAVDTKGDEHPFPFSCFNFSGTWTSETGDEYRITQMQCKRLDIAREFKGHHEAHKSTIVPDNCSRKVVGDKWRGEVRHRWNAKQYGSTVETYRVMRYPDREASEVVLLESVNEALMLETVYHTVKPLDGRRQPYTENYQRIFRRAKLTETDGKPRGPAKR